MWAGQSTAAERLAHAVVAQTRDVALRGRAACWLASSLLIGGKAAEVRDVCAQALASGTGSAQNEILLHVVDAVAAPPAGGRPVRWRGCAICWPMPGVWAIAVSAAGARSGGVGGHRRCLRGTVGRARSDRRAPR